MGYSIKQISTHLMTRFNIFLNWKQSEYKFTKFVDKWISKRKSTEQLSGNIAIVIQPWAGTSTPWFLIAVALFLTQLHKKVTIVVDDFEFGTNRFFFKFQIKSIKKIISSLPSSIEIIELSKLRVNENKTVSQNNVEIDRLSSLNAIHFMRGELNEDGRDEYFNTVHTQLENAYPKIKQLFDEIQFDYVLVAGGIWGSSGLYLKLAELNKIRASTIDSGFGTVLINTKGVAAHQSDIPIAFYQLEDMFLSKIFEIANEDMGERRQGTDHYSTQLTPYNENAHMNNVGVLMLLNIVWDSAALGLHTVFENMPDWITETIEWVIENTDEVITIRQHPAERNSFGKSTDDYHTLIKQTFGDNNRINFIAATDEMNTYNLIENSRFVISFSTTASMEAVSLGKVVVNVSSCYYSELGFVYSAKTKEDYFNYLKDALSGKIKISKKQKEDALKCYYLSQCCNRIHSNFTPQPLDFEKWVKEDPEDVFLLDAVQDYLHAIENGIPISLIQHHKNINKDAANN